MDELRLFYAVPLPEATRQRVAERSGQLRARAKELGIRARWVGEKKLHLTLRFLGNQPGERVGALQAALQRAALGQEVPRLRLEKLTTFGPPARARVLFAAVGGEVQRLGLLLARLEAELEALGVSREPRPFVPHLTLARLLPQRALESLLLEAASFDEEWAAERVVLYRSVLGPAGATHQSLFEVPLSPC